MDTKISDLNSLTKSTIDTVDTFPVVDDSTNETKQISYGELIQPKDSQFAIVGSSDTTKKVQFEVDGLTTATTRTITIQDSNDTLVGRATTDTLTNKTLTAPKITAGSDAKGDIFQLSANDGTLTRIRASSDGDIISWDDATDQWEAIANPSASDASTTVKGVVELATLAETLARTTNGSAAKLVVTPDNLTTVLTYDYAVDAVGTDSYAITVTPIPTAYVAGQTFTFKAGTANTGACSLNVNGLGAKTIKKAYNVDLATGDILANQIIQVVYDGTNMMMTSSTQPRPIFACGQGSFTATGDITIAHGMGVTPRLVKVTSIGYALTNSQLAYSVGNATSTSNETCTYWSGTGGRGQDATHIIYSDHGSGGEYASATLSTLDATNIVFTVDAYVGGGTVYYQWEAHS